MLADILLSEKIIPGVGEMKASKHTNKVQRWKSVILRLLFPLPSLVISLFLLSCSQNEPTLRIASNVWPGYEFVYMARDKGYFDEETVRLVEVPSATAALQSLSAGSIEGAMLTLDEILTARAEGLNLVVVAVLDSSVGADVVMAHPSITRLEELKGKRIGVEQSAVGAVMLDALLHKAKLTTTDVELVYMTVNKHKSAYMNNEVDALVTFEPIKTQVKKTGAIQLFDSSQIPGRIIDVLAVVPEAVQRNANGIKQIIRGHFRARQEFIDNPTEASHILFKRLQIEPDEVPASYEGIDLTGVAENKTMLSGTNPTLIKSAEVLISVMQRANLLKGEVDMNRLVDGSLLPN